MNLKTETKMIIFALDAELARRLDAFRLIHKVTRKKALNFIINEFFNSKGQKISEKSQIKKESKKPKKSKKPN